MSDVTVPVDGRVPAEQGWDPEQSPGPSDLIDDVLDDDVLREVFLYFPAQAYWKGVEEQDDATWLSISHVSRRWRNLSISTPRIWCNIITSPSFWTPLCLERSRSAPINVQLYWSHFLLRYNPSDELVTSILRHLGHTRTLVFDNVPAPSYNRLMPLLQQPADELFDFELHAQIAQGLQSLRIPDDIFSGRIPRLRRLRLKGLALRFKWTNPIFSSTLTSLTLHDLSERVCKSEMYTALHPMIALEYLHLEDVLHVVPIEVTSAPGPPLPEERIILPKLGTLYVKDYVLDVCDFVAHLIIPPFTTVVVEMHQRNEHEDAVPSVAAAARTIATLAAPRASKPGQRFACHHRTQDQFELRMVTPADSSDEKEPGEKDFVRAMFQWRAFNARVERATAFLAFLSALPLHIARELSLYSRDPLSGVTAQDWAALGLFPATEILHITGHAAYGFVHVLSAPGSLPKLRKLTASNVHFASPSRSEGLGTALVRRLPEAPLEVLQMKSCTVAEEQVDTFRGFCGELKQEGRANTWNADVFDDEDG